MGFDLCIARSQCYVPGAFTLDCQLLSCLLRWAPFLIPLGSNLGSKRAPQKDSPFGHSFSRRELKEAGSKSGNLDAQSIVETCSNLGFFVPIVFPKWTNTFETALHSGFRIEVCSRLLLSPLKNAFCLPKSILAYIFFNVTVIHLQTILSRMCTYHINKHFQRCGLCRMPTCGYSSLTCFRSSSEEPLRLRHLSNGCAQFWFCILFGFMMRPSQLEITPVSHTVMLFAFQHNSFLDNFCHLLTQLCLRCLQSFLCTRICFLLDRILHVVCTAIRFFFDEKNIMVWCLLWSMALM